MIVNKDDAAFSYNPYLDKPEVLLELMVSAMKDGYKALSILDRPELARFKDYYEFFIDFRNKYHIEHGTHGAPPAEAVYSSNDNRVIAGYQLQLLALRAGTMARDKSKPRAMKKTEYSAFAHYRDLADKSKVLPDDKAASVLLGISRAGVRKIRMNLTKEGYTLQIFNGGAYKVVGRPKPATAPADPPKPILQAIQPPLPFTQPLTEADVRRIVKEELINWLEAYTGPKGGC